MTTRQLQQKSLPPTPAEELVDRLTAEGIRSAIGACRDGGLPAISLWAVIRLCKSGKLEAIKVSNRWMSTVPAVRRYLVRCAEASRRGAPPSEQAPATPETDRAYLKAQGAI